MGFLSLDKQQPSTRFASETGMLVMPSLWSHCSQKRFSECLSARLVNVWEMLEEREALAVDKFLHGYFPVAIDVHPVENPAQNRSADLLLHVLADCKLPLFERETARGLGFQLGPNPSLAVHIR